MFYLCRRYFGWFILLLSFAMVGMASSEPDDSTNCGPTNLPITKEEELPEVGAVTLYRVCVQDEDNGEWVWIYRDYNIPGQPGDNPEP